MQLLRDEDIDTLLATKPDAVVPSPGLLGTTPNPKLRIQPSSLDLTVGGIFRPNAQLGKKGNIGQPLTKLGLLPGHTAVVETIEVLRLPDDVCAIGFPPHHVSSKGILMTNPGHVDPGYVGTLTFTVINMGRDTYALTQGMGIVTLLLFRLDAAPRFPYSVLYPPSGGSGVTWEMLRALSEDFVDVDRRAKQIAKTQAFNTALLASLGTVILGVVALFGYYSNQSSLSAKFDDLQKQVITMQAAQNQVP